MSLTASRSSRLLRQGGFILTIELLLISTVLIIGSFVGVIAIRDALFERAQLKQSRSTIVVDSQGRKLGPAVDYDEHDAPRIPYIDRTVTPAEAGLPLRNYRVLIGVRDDRFTSREPLYYSNADCTGIPCIKSTSDETSDSAGIDRISSTGSVSYLNALQGGPNYAIGASPNRIKGHLYRETPLACPATEIRSRYISQKVIAGSPCEDFSMGNSVPANTQCLLSVVEDCSCPTGYSSQGDILENYLTPINRTIRQTIRSLPALVPIRPNDIEIGTLCCPIGTVLEESDNLINAVTYSVLDTAVELLNLGPIVEGLVAEILNPIYAEPRCVSEIRLRRAEEVPSAIDSSQNALAPFSSPFRVNLPSDVNDQANPSSNGGFIFVAPDIEG